MIKHLRLFSTLLLLAVASVGWADTYVKVTDANSLSVGDQLLFVAEVSTGESYYVAGDISNSVMTNVEVDVSDNTITTVPEGAVVLTLGGESGKWTFANSEGKLLGATAAKKLAWDKGTTTWSISISDGKATVQNGTNSYGKMLYNVSSPRFAPYTSNPTANMLLIQLYKKEGGSTTETVATPTFTPAAGVYTSAQDVTINTTTEGATIHYTTDGTEPTASSSVYSSAISVSANTTIKAIAVKEGLDNSSIATATYTIVTLEHAGTAEDPYTVADARNAIDANTGVTGVYATGIVSEIVTDYSSQYSNITFDLVDEEGNSETVRAYRCTGEEAANVQVGDVVVVKGNLTKYNTTYEFAQGCEIVSRTSSSTQVAAGLAFSASTASADLSDLASFTAPTLENPNNLPVIYTSSNTEVATVAEDGTVTIKAEGKTTITASSEETEQYLAGTASYTLTVTNSNKQLVTVDADGNITFDLSDNGWGFPEGSSNKTTETKTYTADGYTITLAGGGNNNGHYYNTGYLMLGKSGATLTLPAFDMPVEKIEVVGRDGASSSVVQNIFVGETAVSTATTGATGTNIYEIAEDYKAAGNVYTLKVTSAHNTQITKIKVYKGTIDERANAEIAFSTESLTITQGKEFTAPTFSNPNNVAVTFSTDKADVASWNNGLVLGTATGTAVITATFEGDDDYKPATATLTVTVKEDLNFVDVTEGCGVYQKVTSASDLEAGKRYLMVYETQDDDLNDVADVFNGVENKIGTYVVMPLNSDMVDNTTGTATHPIVLQSAGSGNWYLMDGDNFLYWTSGNYLYCSDVASQAGNTWSVNFGEDGMSINNVNTPERYLQFNTSSPRFACYTGTQKNVVLYKELMVAPISVTIGTSATGADGAYYSSVYYSDKALQVPAKVECQTYKMTDGKLSVSKTYAAGSVIPADEAVVIKASVAGKVNFVVTTTTEQKDANSMLLGCDEATIISESGYKYYKLTLNATKDAGTAGFYYDKNVSDGSTINAAAHKCYLCVPASTEAKGAYVFGDDTDGIRQIENGELTIENAEIYNLSGQRVNKAQKGIYIVNGKKVVVK